MSKKERIEKLMAELAEATRTIELVAADRDRLIKERKELKARIEAVAQARAEAQDRVEKIAESYRELAEEHDALKTAQQLSEGLQQYRIGEQAHAAVVEALWGEGKAFDQLSDAVKDAVSVSGFSTGPAEYPVETAPEALWNYQRTQARMKDEAMGRCANPTETTISNRDYVEGYRKWEREADRQMITAKEAEKLSPAYRILVQMHGHWLTFAKPPAELWADMPWSPLKPQEAIDGCPCKVCEGRR